MATLGTLRNVISSKIGLDATNDQALMDEWINQGVLDVMVRTRCTVSPATLSLSAGVVDYELDPDILRLTDVRTASNIQLSPKSPDQLRDLRRSAYTGAGRYYALDGANLFMVYPTPAAGDTITFYYIPRPATLLVTNDSPDEIPSEFHKLVEWYALAEAADYDDDGSSGIGSQYLGRYEKGIAEAKAAITRKGGRLAPSVPGRSRTTRSVPSQDVW